MKIYVASSWRCIYQPDAVRWLRELGHKVYDFRGAGDGWSAELGAGGFNWSEVDPEWKSWPDDVPRYLRGLEHPRAIEGFNRDMNALEVADVCILVNPCGQSAHAELGFAAGAGKLTAAWCPAIREPDLMLKMADFITDDWKSLELWLRKSESLALEFTPYEFLDEKFLELMNDIGRYGEEKYGVDSFHARAQIGDRSRGGLLRTQKEQILNHARQHITDYENGILHDHFGDSKHQLAAAAFNLLMEFYFSQGE